MNEPITIVVPFWAILAVVAWLSCVVIMLGAMNTQLKLLYNLYCSLRDGQ